MQTIKMTNAATGAITVLVINEKIAAGDTFRLIGRNVAFRATRVYTHKVCGAMVEGVSICGKYRTGARVCDTAQVQA